MRTIVGFFTRSRSPQDDPAAQLLKRATELSKTDMSAAIQTLRAAYEAIAQTDIQYGIETFLRLPLYLQRAGRFTESLHEFHRIFASFLPPPSRSGFSEGVHFNELGVIYDKLRLAAQRQKRADISLPAGALSAAAWDTGRHMHARADRIPMEEPNDQEWAEVLAEIGSEAREIAAALGHPPLADDLSQAMIQAHHRPSPARFERLRALIEQHAPGVSAGR
jgi:hypothetical protein